MDNEFATALAPGAYDAALLRPALTGRGIYTLADSEDPATLTAAVDGRVPLGIAWRGILFWLDLDDTVSASDGVTVIKTADDYVYKVEDPDYRIRSVLSDTVTAPPALPAIGDTYLIPPGATGAWSAHQDDIAIFTRRGWRFEVPVIGKWLLVEDVDGFRRYSATGWAYGSGARSFDAGGIPFSAALGWGAKFEVENQVTTTPPIATKGLRYIVGDAATGDWLGKDKQVAICEVPGVWTLYVPKPGWLAYDKSQSSPFTWNGSVWLSSAGSWIDRKSTGLTLSGSTSGPSGPLNVTYTYSASVAPTNGHRRLVDAVTLAYAAKRAGAVLRFDYSAEVSAYVNTSASIAGTRNTVLALFRDDEVNAIAWCSVQFIINYFFEVPAPDTAAHTYIIAIISGTYQTEADGGFREASSLVRRTFTVQEAA